MPSFNHRCIKIKKPYSAYFGCTWVKCRAQPITHTIRYDYITGRTGRVSFAEKDLCENHARQFCEKHNIDFDNVPVYDPDIKFDKLNKFSRIEAGAPVDKANTSSTN